MQRNDPIVTEQEMFVKSISATCEVGEVRTVRTMSLQDLETARATGYRSPKISMSLEAPDGVAAGDVICFSMWFERDIIEEELERQLAKDTAEKTKRLERETANG